LRNKKNEVFRCEIRRWGDKKEHREIGRWGDRETPR